MSSRVSEVRSERLIEELLEIQGWDLRKPPRGDVLAQHEYKDFPSLKEALVGCGKTGRGGDGVPEYIVMDASDAPAIVVEAKAKTSDLDKACSEAKAYGDAFLTAGFAPLVAGVAGTKESTFMIGVFRHVDGAWSPVTYEGAPISWMPTREHVLALRGTPRLTELRPAIPGAEVLKARAEEINGLLRESGLKDDFRPGAIGAIMLALWKSKGQIRRDSRYILADINQSCRRAFEDGGKPDLALSLRVDEANEKLAVRTLRICTILERLNITTLTAEHDYLGALYEEFFRYTGGNTIGQYFTPRHVTRFAADACQVTQSDTVLDPACGTGGFLIAAMDRMQRDGHLRRSEVVAIVRRQLIGLEDEPVTAALCVANMILRGDGSTRVLRADCFKDDAFPFGEASVVMMNPPFPHRKTDVPPDRFIDRAIEGVATRGKVAVVVPSSLLTRRDKSDWRRRTLGSNTLQAVVSLPGELFQPYASSNTALIVLDKGVPHPRDHHVLFARVDNDGLRLHKGTRVPQDGDQLPAVLNCMKNRMSVPGVCTPSSMTDLDNWAPGAYVEARATDPEAFRASIAEIVRMRLAFTVRFVPQIRSLKQALVDGELTAAPFSRVKWEELTAAELSGSETVDDLFAIVYGQQALESKLGLGSGKSLVISSTGEDNGAYGFFDFPDLIRPPFITVPRTGSIGEARVQEYPCGASSDCLLLFPRPGVPREALYAAAAVVRDERWRFDYGRKMTPDRIRAFPVPTDKGLLAWVKEQLARADGVEESALEAL